MSIADKLTALSAVKAALRSAIEGKGVSVGATPFTGWPGLISSIQAGGGDAPTGMIDGTATTLDLSAWPVTGALRVHAFSYFSSLTSITLPAGMTGSIGNNAFYGCSSLTSITLPAGVTSIGTQVFYGCSSLTSITLPAGMTGSIGAYTFYGCSSLTSITLPAGMTGSIGAYTFTNCSKLTSLTLPAGVTSISTQAFYGSTLRQLVIQRTAGVVTLANVDAFGNSGITATTGDIYVPDALVDTYKTAANWVTFADRIQPLSAYTP